MTDRSAADLSRCRPGSHVHPARRRILVPGAPAQLAAGDRMVVVASSNWCRSAAGRASGRRGRPAPVLVASWRRPWPGHRYAPEDAGDVLVAG